MRKSSSQRVFDWIATAAVTPPAMSCWAWNNTHGRLSRRDSSMPGAWRGEVCPQMEHWHDLITARRLGRAFMGDRDQYAHLTEQIWLIAGTQSMKTRSVLYAGMGYTIDQHPSPKGLILPRLKDFKRVIDNRLRPFVDETPALERHLPRAFSLRKKYLTYSSWTLDTCTVYMLCGEIADDLRQFPMCELFFDEFDLLPINCEGQGDPIVLAMDRQKTWPRSKLAVGATTPTSVDGHGWRRLCSGSHERLLVACPRCRANQELHPDQLRWPDGKSPDEIKVHSLAQWECVRCQHRVADDGTKDRMVTEAAANHWWVGGKWAITGEHPAGHWTPHADFDGDGRLVRVHPCETIVRTGHLNSLYSRFISLSEFAYNELSTKAKGNDEQWIGHLNGWRCEPYIPQASGSVDLATLAAHSTSYGYALGTVLPGVKRIALIGDQQGNSRSSAWFPYIVRGFGEDGESWLIDAGEVHGFDEWEALEQRPYTVGGGQRPADVSVLDGSNGNMRVPLQQWAAAAPKRRMLLTGRFWPDFLVQQRANTDRKASRNRRIIAGARIFNWHTNAFKTELYGRIEGIEGAKKWNLPDDAPPDYLASLTAEEQVTELIRLPGTNGKRPTLVWKPRVVHDETGKVVVRDDNHWWDCEAMAPAVANIMRWEELEKQAPATISAADWFKRR